MKKIFLSFVLYCFALLNGVAQTCTLNLTSAAGSNLQYICKNSTLVPITYSCSIAPTVSGLPNGISTSVNSNILSMTGTATVEGAYVYTVTLSGGCSPSTTTTGTIIVGGGFIPNNNYAQRACPGISIDPINYYSVGTSTCTPLPSGISFTQISGNNYTITGSTTVKGDYGYTITSVGTCTTQTTYPGDIAIKDMDLNILTTGTSAASSCDGYIEAVAKGNSPYSYLWNNNSTDVSINNVCNGTYSVTVTDVSGCTATSQANVGVTSKLTPLTLKVYAQGVSNDNLCDGVAYVKLSGGTPPYSISFAGNTVAQTTETIYNLCSGFYTVNSTDAQSNTATQTFVVSSPQTLFNSIDPVYLADSTFVDTLVTNAISNCLINLSKIDSIKITSHTISNNVITVIWSLYNNGAFVSVELSYPYSTPGLYTLIIDLYCTNRTSGSVRGVDDVNIEARTLPTTPTPETTGINSIIQDNIKIYPNPFSNQLSVMVDITSLLKITDISGKTIHTCTINQGLSTIDMTNFNSGIYFVTINNNQGCITKKLIKN